MGRIDISFETVRQKSDKLNGQIRSRLEKELIAGYEKLESSLLQLMQESADAFEETDISYKEAVQNLGQGESD